MGRYAEILRTPRVGWLLAATTLGRIPFAVNALAVLLLVRETTGSFALAGAAVGALTLGAGLGAPLAARLIDRRGPGMLMVLAGVHAAGVLVLVALASGGAPDPLVLIAASLIGSSYPPAGSVLRARWPELLGGDPGLVRSAYALDSVVIEVSFVSGPLLTAGAVALAGPKSRSPARRGSWSPVPRCSSRCFPDRIARPDRTGSGRSGRSPPPRSG